MQKRVLIIIGVATLLVLVVVFSFSGSVLFAPAVAGPLVLACTTPSTTQNIQVNDVETVVKSDTIHHTPQSTQNFQGQTAQQIQAQIAEKCSELEERAGQECLDKLRNEALNGREFSCAPCPTNTPVGICDPLTYIPDNSALTNDVATCQTNTYVVARDPGTQAIISSSTKVQVMAMCGGNGVLTLECANQCTPAPQGENQLDGGGQTEGNGKGSGTGK